VDWAGVRGSNTEKKGDIYVVTKNLVDLCDGGVGKIPVSFHKNLPAGSTTSSVYNMPAVLPYLPSQGPGVTCSDGPFRAWTGADMRRDGRLIAMIRGGAPASVHFFPRLADQSVGDAFSSPPCPYVSATSVGLPNERKHEAVAFVGAAGTRLADISECQGSCSPTLYLYELEYPDSNFEEPEELPNGWRDISVDTFELGWGSYTPGGASASVIDTSAACSGGAAAEIKDDLGVESSFYHQEDKACKIFDLLRITFEFMYVGYNPLDSLFVEISLNQGADFHIVGSWTRGVNGFNNEGTCYDGYLLLSPAQFNEIGFGDKVRLRFRSSANSNTDRVYVDNIRFEGYDPLLAP